MPQLQLRGIQLVNWMMGQVNAEQAPASWYTGKFSITVVIPLDH